MSTDSDREQMHVPQLHQEVQRLGNQLQNFNYSDPMGEFSSPQISQRFSIAQAIGDLTIEIPNRARSVPLPTRTLQSVHNNRAMSVPLLGPMPNIIANHLLPTLPSFRNQLLPNIIDSQLFPQSTATRESTVTNTSNTL